MHQFWKALSNSSGFMPHGHCYLWDKGLVRLHPGSDLAISLAYVAILLTLVYFVLRAKGDIPFSRIFVGFGVFIIAGWATYFVETWTIWTSVYRLAVEVELVTAAASVLTAIVLLPLAPKSLAMLRWAKPSEQRNTDLEERVRARTAEMAAIVEHSSDASISLDPNGCLESWNQAAEQMYGCPLETTHLSKTGGLIDVTAHKRSTPNAMVTVNSEGRIVMVNAETRGLLGYFRNELLGREVEAAPRARALGEAREGEGRELYRLRRDGSEFPVEIVLTASARELAAANAELDAFSYLVSHDLRAPLRQTAGFSRIPVEEYRPEPKPEANAR